MKLTACGLEVSGRSALEYSERSGNFSYKKKDCALETSFQGAARIIDVFERLHLNLNLNTAGEFQLHQGINSLLCRAVDVNQTLV